MFMLHGIVWCWRSNSCFRLSASLPYMSIDKGIHSQADHHKNGTQDIDGQIIVGIGEGQVTGAEQIEDGPAEEQAKGGNAQAKQEQQGEGVAHDPLRLVVLSSAPVDGT